MKKIALILRKSPGKKQEESIDKQRELIVECINREVKEERVFVVFEDKEVSGDDKVGRKALHRFFSRISEFDFAYSLDVDRFSRSYLGLYWFHKYFEGSKCELRFVNGPRLYTDSGNFNPDGYLQFFILCAFASYELLSIRRRTSIGRERAQKKGVKFGRKRCDENLFKGIITDKVTMSYSELERKYGLPRSRLWNIVNKYNSKS